MDPFILLAIGVVIVLSGIVWLKLNAFIALMVAGLVVAALTPAENIQRHLVAKGATAQVADARAHDSLGIKLGQKFGHACTQLGLLIAMASIIGSSLLASGGAERIVRSALGLFGESRAPLVFGISGFVLGIPIFFETVFLLLIPIVRAMSLRTGKNFLLFVMCSIAGATMTHSLVPPTPGPLFVAAALKVDMGLMMIGGLLLGLFTASSGMAYAWWLNRHYPIPVPPTEGVQSTTPARVWNEGELPPLWLALLPIFVPVVLISGQTISEATMKGTSFARWMNELGHPTIAVTIAAAIALVTLLWKQKDRLAVRSEMQAALADAGMIILVIAGGGVFGSVLQDTGVGERIQGLAEAHRIAVLPLAFFVTALVRIAQGSATVAMVTSVGILGGFASATTLGFHPLYLALAIGCGSKPIPWMNDAGFWVVCKMTGFKEIETLRSFSLMLALMGLVGFVLVMIAAHFFPLV